MVSTEGQPPMRMKTYPRSIARWTAGVAAVVLGIASFRSVGEDIKAPPGAQVDIQKDLAASREAFKAIYPVLMHPRCVNCHPSGDSPLQGEQSRIHAMAVKRGPDGKGVFAMKCSNCHQAANAPGKNMPPGDPGWHLPPADMKMVFQGKSAAELAAQLIDPKRNGGLTPEQLVEHMNSASLVLWAWNPGEGRAKPPMPHEEFARKFKEWIDKGAAIPE